MGVDIRELMPRDLPELIELWRRVAPDQAPTEEQVQGWSASRPSRSLVAVRAKDGSIVAAVISSPRREYLVVEGADDGVTTLLLDKAVGKLLSAGEHHCRMDKAALSLARPWCISTTNDLKPLPVSDDALKDVAHARQG